jgi:CubicO group peptidase (beta-lactamase class C family)
LGLSTFQPDYQWLDIPHRATGYRKRDGNVERLTDSDVSWKLGGGGFVSTIDDLALWCAAVARGDLLKPETWSLVATPQPVSEERSSGYGLGFRSHGEGNDLCLMHSGSQEKTRTYLAAFPCRGFGAVAMTNSEYGDPRLVVDAITKAMLDLNPPPDSSE